MFFIGLYSQIFNQQGSQPRNLKMKQKIIGLISVSLLILIFFWYRNMDAPGLTGNLEIQTQLSQELAGDIEIVSATGKKPGELNAVEAIITLKNTSETEIRILARGGWLDGRGGSYGGTSSVRVLAPGQLETFQAATNSKSVSEYQFSVSLTDKTDDELLTQSLASKELNIAEGQGMTYTETPTKVIPPWSPRGVANGEAFKAETIVFKQDFFPAWRLTISDRQFDVLKGAGFERFTQKDLQTIEIDLPNEPKTGSVFEKKMSYGGGIFQIKTSPSAFETTSWNTSIAYYIEITSWKKGPSGDASCNSLQASTGTASGRLYISFQGSEYTLDNSWISGVFEDASIVYCGPRDA